MAYGLRTAMLKFDQTPKWHRIKYGVYLALLRWTAELSKPSQMGLTKFKTCKICLIYLSFGTITCINFSFIHLAGPSLKVNIVYVYVHH